MPLKDRIRNDQREAGQGFPAPMDLFLRAVNPLSKEAGTDGERDRDKPFLDFVTYTYNDAKPEAFRQRREWLISAFNLKPPKTDHYYDPDTMVLLKDPGSQQAKDILEARRNLMQYEDESIFASDALWTMTAVRTQDASRFLFYYTQEGKPDKCGVDTLTDALRLFADEYKPAAISHLLLGNVVAPDYDALIKMSRFRVKRHRPPTVGAQAPA